MVFGNLVLRTSWEQGAHETQYNVQWWCNNRREIIEERGKYALYNDSKYSKLGSYFLYWDNWGTPKEFNEANVALWTVVKEGYTKGNWDLYDWINGRISILLI
jgi:hypothetical protein